MNAAISEDAEVLSGGDSDAILIEGTELNGVTVEWGFEDGHDGFCAAPKMEYELSVCHFLLFVE